MYRLSAKMSMALVTAMVVGFAGASTQAQQSVPQVTAGSPRLDAEFPGKPELLRRIAMYEAAQRSAEATHPGLESMVKIYSNLAALYEDVSMFSRAEDEVRREIAILRSGPGNELADAMGQMAVIHIAMGDVRAAERDDLEALRVRESVGDPVGTALTWSDLADVYIKQRSYKKAVDYAQRSMAILADNPKLDVADRVGVRQTLAYALCGLKEYEQAIPMLKDAIELEKSAYGSDSLMVGTGKYLLGHAYWKDGKMDEAAELMASGTARMKEALGWGHTVYLNAMSEYAKFLRQRGQMEAASAAESEVKMANAVVDARSLTGRASDPAGMGLR